MYVQRKEKLVKQYSIKTIIIIIFIILSGSCIQRKNQFINTGDNQKNDDAAETSTSISENEKEFYNELKELLNKAGIYSYDSPMETPYFDFTLKNLDNHDVSLSDFNGQTILLNFWATWCGPCVGEMPSMEKLYNDMKNEGFVIIAVNVGENKNSVRRFLTESKFKITFPVLLDSTREIGSHYGANSIPLSYLIDTKGYLVGGIVGAKNWDSDNIKNILQFIQSRGN